MRLRAAVLLATASALLSNPGTAMAQVSDETRKLLDAEAKVFDTIKGRVSRSDRESAADTAPRPQYRSLRKFGADHNVETSAPDAAALPTVAREASAADAKSLESRSLVSPAAMPEAEDDAAQGPQRSAQEETAPPPAAPVRVRRYDYELGRSFTTVIDPATGKAMAVEDNTSAPAPLTIAEIARALAIARAGNPAIDSIAKAVGEGKYSVVALLKQSSGPRQARQVSLWIDRPRLSPRVTVDLVAEKLITN